MEGLLTAIKRDKLVLVVMPLLRSNTQRTDARTHGRRHACTQGRRDAGTQGHAGTQVRKREQQEKSRRRKKKMVVDHKEEFTSVPVVDIHALLDPSSSPSSSCSSSSSSQAKAEVAKQIYDACRYADGVRVREKEEGESGEAER